MPAHTFWGMKTPRNALPRIPDRIGILYIEFARIKVANYALVIEKSGESATVPAAKVSSILAGPGTSITHDAAVLLADTGTSLIWVGRGAIRCYGAVVPLAVRSTILEAQVKTWADPQQRLAAARRAYGLRFPDDAEAAKFTMSQLRAAEGRRVKAMYRDICAEHGVTWTGRNSDWSTADPLNRAVTSAYQAAYGLAHAVVGSLGAHPALGFIHTGHALSFVYDVADLVKIPDAFTAAVEAHMAGSDPIRMMNQTAHLKVSAKTMVDGIYSMLAIDRNGFGSVNFLEWDDLELFDPRGPVPSMDYDGSVEF